MKLTVELDRETDGRWIAEVVDLPGVMVYGATREEALAAAQALALRVLADKLEHGETPAVPLDLSFVVNAA
jgi:predicted RNase H-like HicB family nuclease